MKKIILAVVTMFLSLSIFAEGPVYNFHFLNGEIPQKSELAQAPIVAPPLTQAINDHPRLNPGHTLSFEIGLSGTASDEYLAVDSENFVSSEAAGANFAVIVPLGTTWSFRAGFGIETYRLGYSYENLEVYEYGDGSSSGPSSGSSLENTTILSFQIGLQGKKQLTEKVALIGAANIDIVQKKIDIYEQTEWTKENFELNRYGFEIKVGPQISLGKRFYVNLLAAVGVRASTFEGATYDFKPYGKGQFNLGIRI